MRSRSDHHRPLLEHLEDRCTPDSALDLFVHPLAILEAREPAVSGRRDTKSDALLLAAAILSPGRSTSPLPKNGGAATADQTQSKQVPFKGRLDGVVTHTPADPLTDFVLVEGTGTATHLGRLAVSVPHFVNLPTRTATGSYELTAANGDKVYAEFTGQARPTATPGVISIVETATITGGTGRFSGATGHFVVERLYDRIAGTTSGSFEGTISSPGS